MLVSAAVLHERRPTSARERAKQWCIERRERPVHPLLCGKLFEMKVFIDGVDARMEKVLDLCHAKDHPSSVPVRKHL